MSAHSCPDNLPINNIRVKCLLLSYIVLHNLHEYCLHLEECRVISDCLVHKVGQL
jgi:hypothetical protein